LFLILGIVHPVQIVFKIGDGLIQDSGDRRTELAPFKDNSVARRPTSATAAAICSSCSSMLPCGLMFKVMLTLPSASNLYCAAIGVIFAANVHQIGAAPISPNPAAHNLCLHTSSGEPVQLVRFWNTNGQLVFSAKPTAPLHCFELPSSLPPGIYTVEALFADGYRNVQKLVVAR